MVLLSVKPKKKSFKIQDNFKKSNGMTKLLVIILLLN